MSRPLLIVVSVLLAAGLAAGGYFAVKWLRKPPPEVVTHPPGKPQERQSREVPAVAFADVTAASGVRFHHEAGFSGHKLLPETMGGGVAIIDYDGDDKPDILFVNGAIWPGHANPAADTPRATLKLYRNLGDMKFEDVTEKAGLYVSLYGMGVAVGDYDNDGRPDVFVSCVGKHRLFRNVDGKKFEDATDAAGVGGPGALPKAAKDEFANWKPPIPFGSSATFLDYDGDGRLDLFVCHYVTWSPAVDRAVASSIEGGKRTFVQPRDFEGAQCALYRNVDGKKFEDVSAKAGVVVTEKEGTAAGARERPVGKALGVVACDPDGDGWPDLIVANDTVRNFFFHNVAAPGGGRKFEEKGYPIGAAYADEGKPRGGMGIDWGEFATGRSAAVVANFANEPLTLLEKDRARLAFSDSALSTGLAGPSKAALKFGTLFFDYDNDGRLDLFVCNGHIEPEIATIQSSQAHAQPAAPVLEHRRRGVLLRAGHRRPRRRRPVQADGRPRVRVRGPRRRRRPRPRPRRQRRRGARPPQRRAENEPLRAARPARRRREVEPLRDRRAGHGRSRRANLHAAGHRRARLPESVGVGADGRPRQRGKGRQGDRALAG